MSDTPAIACQLQLVGGDILFEQIKTNAKSVSGPAQMITKNGAGKTLIICGAGPSLAQHHDVLEETSAHQIWACNSALPYLKDHDLPVSHGFCVDQSEAMLGPAEWERTWDVTYLLGTSVFPGLVQHLTEAHRRIMWFHNFLGIPNPEGWEPPKGWAHPDKDASYEWYLYCSLFPSCVQVGYGLNSVPRALCLALWMGFSKILVLGADCAAAPDQAPRPALSNSAEHADWAKQVSLYASGRTVAEAYGDDCVMVEGGINGRRWVTRTDMLISAQHLVQMKKAFPHRVYLIGDTLPNAMMTLTDAELATLPRLTGKGMVEGFAMHKDLESAYIVQAPVDEPLAGVHNES